MKGITEATGIYRRWVSSRSWNRRKRR